MTFYIHLNCVSLLFVACIHPSGGIGVAVGVKRTRTLSLCLSLSLSLCACQPNCLALELLIIYWNRCVALRNQGGSWRRQTKTERERVKHSPLLDCLLSPYLSLSLSVTVCVSACVCVCVCEPAVMPLPSIGGRNCKINARPRKLKNVVKCAGYIGSKK